MFGLKPRHRPTWRGFFTQLTQTRSSHTIHSVNILQEYEEASRASLVELLRSNPEATLGQVQRTLGPKAWKLLLSVPFAALHVPFRNGQSKKKVSDPDAVISAYLRGLSKGDSFRTSDLMQRTGISRSAVLRRLEGDRRFRLRGRGCQAYFEVVK